MEDQENLRENPWRWMSAWGERPDIEQEKSRIIPLKVKELPLDELVERLRERLKDALKSRISAGANVEELNKKITKV